MKNNLKLYLKPNVLGFSLFQVFFFSLMWTSKTLHILFFEKNTAMVNFGVSYSAMALAGYFSFVIGYFADILGFRKVLLTGGLMYALGLYLRIYPQSFSVAISSGLIAGIGASCVLCALRLWMLEVATEDTTARLVGLKSATSSFGTAIGCMLAGVLPTIINMEDAYMTILSWSGIGMGVLTFAFYLKGPRPQVVVKKSHLVTPFKNFKTAFKESKRFFVVTTVLGLMTGFYVSFISPYLPLIMKDKGLSLLAIGFSTGSFALIRFFIDPLIAQYVEKNKAKSLQIFLGAEIVIALITGGFLWTISKWAFVILLLLRSASLGFSTIAEEVLWIRTFPKKQMGLFFGLNQSAFFLGDFLGGLVNGYFYKNFGLDLCIFIVLTVMFFNACLFLKFFKGTQQDESVLAAEPV